MATADDSSDSNYLTWGKERAAQWATENFSEEVAKCFIGKTPKLSFHTFTSDTMMMNQHCHCMHYHPWYIIGTCIYFEFLEQEVDGETLPLLVNCASVEQLVKCGLKTVKDQMKLRKTFHSLSSSDTICSSYPSSLDSASTPKSKKLTLRYEDTFFWRKANVLIQVSLYWLMQHSSKYYVPFLNVCSAV